MKKFWKKALKKALEYLIAGLGVLGFCLSSASAGQPMMFGHGQVLDVAGSVFSEDPAAFTGDLSLVIGKKLIFDADATSNDYIYASANGFLDVYTAGALTAQFGASRLKLSSGFPLALGNASNYRLTYNSVSTALEITSTDCDGGGTDCIPLYIDDGTSDLVNTIEVKGATTTYGGAFEDLTCSASASLTTSGLIPDGAILTGITTRVTTALTTATAFNVGDGSDADIYGVQSTVTQGATTDNSDATAQWGNPQLSAGEVTLTFTGTCDAGVIRVVAHYITVGAPTSN